MTYGLTIFQFFSIQFLDKIVNRPYQNLRYRCGDFKTTLLQGWGRGKKNYMNYEASTNINFWSKTAKTEIWFFVLLKPFCIPFPLHCYFLIWFSNESEQDHLSSLFLFFTKRNKKHLERKSLYLTLHYFYKKSVLQLRVSGMLYPYLVHRKCIVFQLQVPVLNGVCLYDNTQWLPHT